MLYYDFEANTEKEATELALESLGLKLNDVTIEPLNEVKKSFFGLGKKEKVKIRVYYKEKNDIDEVLEIVKTLISKIEKNSIIEITNPNDDRYHLNIESPEPAKLIGKSGHVIQSIQSIVNAIINKHDLKIKIIIDVDNYNTRSEKNVISKAIQAAKKVQKNKKPYFLDPLNPFQRRLIHIELKKLKGIATESEGDGKFKKIKIFFDNEQQK